MSGVPTSLIVALVSSRETLVSSRETRSNSDVWCVHRTAKRFARIFPVRERGHDKGCICEEIYVMLK